MIEFITNFFRTFLLSLLLIDYLERTHPKKYDAFFITLSYNLIYVYSKAQIFYMNIVKTVNKKIEETPKLLKLKNDLDLLMNQKNGTVIMIECIKNGILSDNLSTTECDFALYSRLDDSKKCLNKKIVYDLDELDKDVYEVSDIKFLLVELKNGVDTYKIDLKTDAYNFYIVGNKFTKQFFQYYLIEILKITESVDNFSIKIIDHDVNTVDLDFSDKNDHILLEKTGYKVSIVNNENHINDNKEENEEK